MQQYRSKDTVVAVIDTGVTPDQLDRDRILPGINFSDEGGTYDTSDHHGHGTALAKTILGIAPQCRLLPIKLMTRRGSLRDLKRIDAVFDWIIDHRADLGINIICTAFANFSHATSDELHRGTHLQQQIAKLREMNVATIAPAGNWYREHRQQNSQGMAWPAILREVVSVGALQRQPDGLWLTKNTQRLHADLNTGCRTTVFTEPGELGETSGAAAVVTGCLALDSRNCIGLDPGVRTFLTGFDGENILEIGNGSISKVAILCQRLDKLQSQITKSKGRANKRLRWKLRKQSEAIRTRIRNLTNEVHSKASALLTKNYKHIFLPTFETSQMVVKKKRKLRSKTARNMLTWSHYRFKQVLKFHALKRDCVVHQVQEEYTKLALAQNAVMFMKD